MLLMGLILTKRVSNPLKKIIMKKTIRQNVSQRTFVNLPVPNFLHYIQKIASSFLLGVHHVNLFQPKLEKTKTELQMSDGVYLMSSGDWLKR